MRASLVLRTALILAFGWALHAQVEPELVTKTDLSDIYKAAGAQNTLVAIYDFTPASRGIFESSSYLTERSRDSFIGGPQGAPSVDATISNLFKTMNSNNLGWVMAVSQYDAKRNATQNFMGTDVSARLYAWPYTSMGTNPSALLQGGVEVRGVLYYTDSAGNPSPAYWNTDAATTLAAPKNASGAIQQRPVTHVRFRITGDAGTVRDIYLPCPWKVHDSPSTVLTTDKNYQKYSRTFGSDTIVYDTWSENHLTDTGVVARSGGLGVNKWTSNDQIIGAFFYSTDYLAWIFGGKCISNTDRSAWTTTSGYAIPSQSDTSNPWTNNLPVMTRYQSLKVASINVFLDKQPGLLWVYRYLAPWYPGQTSEEEGRNATSGPSTDPGIDLTTAASSTTMRRDLRPLTYTNANYGLKEKKSSLQNIGPDGAGWDITTLGLTKTHMWGYDNGTFTNIDTVTPEPLAYALANTYRMIYRNRSNTTLFGSGGTACPGKIFVLPFLTNGPNDSYNAALDQESAALKGNNGPQNGYIPYATGGSSPTKCNGGSYPYTGSLPSLDPSDTTGGQFHPGVIAATAAHAVAGDYKSGSSPAINTSKWDAPWSTNTNAPFAVQTMVVSLAVPGSYKLGSTNNGDNPHEQMFMAAQWGDPARSSWSKSNGGKAPDSSVVVGGQVFYFPASDPNSLEQYLSTAASFIVSAGAALSAPATPATGVQNANQAFFGTFATNPRNNTSAAPSVWSGTFYSIGLDRSLGAFQFYGNQSGNLLPAAQVLDPSVSGAFDRDNLWSSYKIFSNYQNPDSTKLLPYAADASNTGVLGSPLKWYQRRMLIVDGNGKLVPLAYDVTQADPAGWNLTQLTKVISDTNSGTTNVGDTTLTTRIPLLGYSSAANMLRFLMGAFDETLTQAVMTSTSANPTNGYKVGLNRDGDDVTPGSSSPQRGNAGHVNIMGDVINSSPLAVELAKDLASLIDLPAGQGKLSANDFFKAAYANSASDPHTRLIIVGTNTGVLHCFVEVSYRPAGGTAGAVQAQATELWAFLPPNLMPLLWDVYQSYANKITTDKVPHKYAVDGDPVLFFRDQPGPNSVVGDGRVGLNKGEDAVAVFGMRKGSRDYYGIQIADGDTGSIIPSAPALAFHVDALGGKVVGKSGTWANSTLTKLGMGTALPAFGRVFDTSGKAVDSVFISGGYSNAQIDANYQKKYGNPTLGVGKLILAIKPTTGEIVDSSNYLWDFSSSTSMGAIAGGVSPATVIQVDQGMTQRLYFGDVLGGLWAINSNNSAATPNFRADNASISTWISTPRLIFSDKAKLARPERFTNAPDVFKLPNNYPVFINDGTGTGATTRPLTVMVSIGSGDRNNPIDADESYIDPTTNKPVTALPPSTDRFYVIADLQNATAALTSDNLTKIDSNWNGGSQCLTTPLADALNPSSSGYLWNVSRGYYFQMSDQTGSHPFALNEKTYDKMMISPLTKQGAIFYSFFSVLGTSGFSCSAFAQTRTYRQCDLMAPLFFDPRIPVTTSINKDGQTSAMDLCSNSKGSLLSQCSGLTFAFNSISSQLADTGDYVMQGGARSTQQGATYSQNTPDIKSVKDSPSPPGFRLRTWRIVR